MFGFKRKSNPVEKGLISLETSIFIASNEADLGSLGQHVSDSEKVQKWFNFKPIITMNFESRYLEVGSKVTFRSTLPPFHYNITFVKILPNELYEGEVSGALHGKFIIQLIKKDNGILFNHDLHVRGKNLLSHLYYLLFLAPPHELYMKFRFKVLKRNLAAERVVKKSKGVSI